VRSAIMDSNNTFELETDAEKVTELYVRAFNAGDAEAVNRMYTDEAVAVWEPGKPLTGQERRDHVVEFLRQGATMSAKNRQTFVTDDTALLIVDWTITTGGADGEQARLEGVGVDVLRRGDDGKWRYAIDDPYGDAT